MDVWDLGNSLVLNKTTKNAVPNLPMQVDAEEAKLYDGRRCLLEIKEPPEGGPFFATRFACLFVCLNV